MRGVGAAGPQSIDDGGLARTVIPSPVLVAGRDLLLRHRSSPGEGSRNHRVAHGGAAGEKGRGRSKRVGGTEGAGVEEAIVLIVADRACLNGDPEDIPGEVAGAGDVVAVFADVGTAVRPQTDGEADFIRTCARAPGSEADDAAGAGLGGCELQVSVPGGNLLPGDGAGISAVTTTRGLPERVADNGDVDGIGPEDRPGCSGGTHRGHPRRGGAAPGHDPSPYATARAAVAPAAAEHGSAAAAAAPTAAAATAPTAATPATAERGSTATATTTGRRGCATTAATTAGRRGCAAGGSRAGARHGDYGRVGV